LGLGEGLTTPRHKKQLIRKCYTRPRIWTDALERPRLRKIDMIFGNWNFKSLYRVGSLKTVASELAKVHRQLHIFLWKWEWPPSLRGKLFRT
jgi:hypothetical protein